MSSLTYVNKMQFSIKSINNIIEKYPHLDYISDIISIDSKKYLFNDDLETIIEEENEQSSSEDSLYSYVEDDVWKQQKSHKKSKKKKTTSKKPFVPKLFCNTTLDSKHIRSILNSVSKNIVKNINNLKNNNYVIFLNIDKDYTVNSKEFNLIQGILIAKKQSKNYRLEHNGKFLNITFDKSVNINHHYLKYYENTQIGLRITNIL